jgi:ABC-2 type transport system permease protein
VSEASIAALLIDPSELRSGLRLTWATARRYLLRFASQPVMLVRAPVSVLILLTYFMAYQVAGVTDVDGANAIGFLYIGSLAIDAWVSTVWGSGYAFQWERYEGTIESLMLSPASRVAVVLGNGIGEFIWNVPAQLLALIPAFLLGARFEIDDPVAALISFLAIYLSSLCVGVACAGLFILSRRANALANFLMTPIFLLAGFIVPRSALPDWLAATSNILPIAHAVDALRAATLTGASLADTWRSLLACAVTSAVFVVIGLWGPKRVEYVSKRLGTLDLTA